MVNILIIDDDPTARMIAAQALDGFRCEIHEADNAEDGRALAEELRPQVVFLDLHMPDEEGLDLLPILRQMDERMHILVMTSNPIAHGADDLLLAQQLGADRVFIKPIPIQEVRYLAAHWLAQPVI